MSPTRAAVVDLDGTVWRGQRLVDGADAGLATLRERMPVVFLTNGTGLRPERFADRLAAVGLPRDASEVVTAASATAAYVADACPGARTFVVGTDPLREACRAAGVTVVESGPADVLVVGRAPELDQALLQRTLEAVGPETAFVAANTDATHPVEGGEEPGAGATVGAIRGMLDREPTVVGKPSTRMARRAADVLGVDPAECLLVGDRLETDIRMGEDADMTTVLVLSGATDRRDLSETETRPDHVVDSLGDIGEVLEGP
jgi:HAD superfamily hydrolase (TIGR01450 family)